MDKVHKDLLISNRVELVEHIDTSGGLFTQLLAKKVINQRKVNEIKVQRTPEAQVEELLSYLPKKDCFDVFCEALIADDQEHIIKKFLKLPSKKAASSASGSVGPESVAESSTLTSDPHILQPNGEHGLVSKRGGETTDSSAPSPKKRPIHKSHAPPSILCIKEPDDKYLYIQCSNPPQSPDKRRRMVFPAEAGENTMVSYVEDETRYSLKHFVSDEGEVMDGGDNRLVILPGKIPDPSSIVVMDNPQSILTNPNIIDPSRYVAAFARQPAEKPFVERSVNSPQVLSRPSIESESSSPSPYTTYNPSIRLVTSENSLTRTPVGIGSNLRGGFTKTGEGHLVLTNSDLDVSRLQETSRVYPQSVASSLKNPQHHSISYSHHKSFPSALYSKPSLQYFSDPAQMLQHKGILPQTKNFHCPGGNLLVGDQDRNFLDPSSNQLNADSLDTMLPPQIINGLSQNVDSLRDQELLAAGCLDLEQEIDLPDGCVTVKVEHSNRQFFLNNYKKSYSMRQIPRGWALVINVDEVEGKPPRKGTNFDRDNLCNLLTQLHFNILIYNDQDGLSAQEMVNKLRAFAKLKDHNNYDACFICLLSHGEEGYIFGTDGKRIPLEEIFMLFGNTNCTGLIGKPKVFIIQACRGGTLDKGVRMDEPDGGTLPTKSPSIQQLPSMSDMLICYPTLMGYYAWRNRARGSWYIEAIVQVFMRFAKNEDICAMLNRVNQVVSRKVSECNQKEMNQMSQMSEFKSTLRQPHLFLFPGIGCSVPQ